MITMRQFLLIVCIMLTHSKTFIQAKETLNYKNAANNFKQENLLNQSHKIIIKRNSKNFKNTLKYILFWTNHDVHPFSFFKESWETFFDKKCSITNCYVTFNKLYFKGDLTKFHAIAFNGRNIHGIKSNDLPKIRSQKQKYIYINYESAENFPVCSDTYNDFFNWTWTYRLDSDIPSPYFHIMNTEGKTIGPKKKMEWDETFYVEGTNKYEWKNKTKAVAWFVSHCKTRGKRETYARELKEELLSYGATLDIYGRCGPLKCPRSDKKRCEAILEKDYYFYLSFENSLCEDYVTEKVITPLRNNVVPIVFGGADYKRFLPPGSYLDANKMSPKKLAAKINANIQSPESYSQFFRWQSLYQYYELSGTDIVCNMCKILNDQTFYEQESVYRNFKDWWHPNAKKRCRE